MKVHYLDQYSCKYMNLFIGILLTLFLYTTDFICPVPMGNSIFDFETFNKLYLIYVYTEHTHVIIADPLVNLVE